MLKKEELKKLEIAKLVEECHKAKKELFAIKFKTTTGQSKEIHKVKDLKRYIARVKTIQRQKAEGLKTETKEQKEEVVKN